MTHGFLLALRTLISEMIRIRLREKKNAWLKEENQKDLEWLKEHRIHFNTSHCHNSNNEKHLLKVMAYAGFNVFCALFYFSLTASYL